MIKSHNIKVVSAGLVVAHDIEAVVLKVNTFDINHIRIRVSLVGLFMPYIRLPVQASLFFMIILAMVVVSL